MVSEFSMTMKNVEMCSFAQTNKNLYLDNRIQPSHMCHLRLEEFYGLCRIFLFEIPSLTERFDHCIFNEKM
jgi:hypothetical protein